MKSIILIFLLFFQSTEIIELKPQLYWGVNCQLLVEENSQQLNEIIRPLNNNKFINCTITCTSYHLPFESRHCGLIKAKELKKELVRRGITDSLIKIEGINIVTDSLLPTEITVKIISSR